MAFCVHCGMRVPDGEQTCAACSAKMSPGPRCPKCGQPYASPEAKFCMSCGVPRTAAHSASQPAAPPAQPGTQAGPGPRGKIPPPTPPAAPVQPGVQPRTTAVAPPTQSEPGPQTKPAAGPGPAGAPVRPAPTASPATQPITPAAKPVPQPPSPPAPQPAAPGQVCPNCGMTVKVGAAMFCIYCAAPLTTAPPPAPPVVETTQVTAPLPEPLSETQQAEVEAMTQQRLTAYQRIGRRFITACRQGLLTPDQLPEELAGELNQALEALQNGHNRLARAGVCPRCQDAPLASGTGQCPKCGLTVTT